MLLPLITKKRRLNKRNIDDTNYGSFFVIANTSTLIVTKLEPLVILSTVIIRILVIVINSGSGNNTFIRRRGSAVVRGT